MKTDLFNFTPAKYYPGKDARVEYYITINGEWKRERIRVNRVPKGQSQRKWAAYVVNQINDLLYSGRNPKILLQKESGHDLKSCLDYFMGNFMPDREDSVRTYRSVIKIFSEWCQLHNLLTGSVNEITHAHALKFLADQKSAKNLSIRTYNNYIGVLKTVFNKLVENKLAKENPFSLIKKRRAKGKNRDVVPPKVLSAIKKDLEKNDPKFLLLSKLVFYCGIRPTELCRLQVRNLRLDIGIIYIESDQAKDHDSAPITLPSSILQQLADHVKDAQPNHHIFSVGLVPGKHQIDGRNLSKRWDRMRDRLNLDKRYKLYSMKDTGALAIARNVDSPVELKDQFRHSSLETTSAYIQRAKPVANPNIVKMVEEW